MQADMAFDLHDRLRAAQTPRARWSVLRAIFAEAGLATFTAGTGRREALDALSVRTTASAGLIADYLGAKADREDRWIHHCASTTAPDHLDVVCGPVQGPAVAGEKLRGVLADHGIRHACLVPVYGGQRPGGFVFYAHDSEQSALLTSPAGLRHLCAVAAIAGAYWRPEDDLLAEEAPAPDRYQMLSPLPARERETLMWLARGLQSAEIAHRMGIEPVTVSKHLQGARLRLGARTREQAVAIAVRDGLLHP